MESGEGKDIYILLQISAYISLSKTNSSMKHMPTHEFDGENQLNNRTTVLNRFFVVLL